MHTFYSCLQLLFVTVVLSSVRCLATTTETTNSGTSATLATNTLPIPATVEELSWIPTTYWRPNPSAPSGMRTGVRKRTQNSNTKLPVSAWPFSSARSSASRRSTLPLSLSQTVSNSAILASKKRTQNAANRKRSQGTTHMSTTSASRSRSAQSVVSQLLRKSSAKRSSKEITDELRIWKPSLKVKPICDDANAASKCPVSARSTAVYYKPDVETKTETVVRPKIRTVLGEIVFEKELSGEGWIGRRMSHFNDETDLLQQISELRETVDNWQQKDGDAKLRLTEVTRLLRDTVDVGDELHSDSALAQTIPDNTAMDALAAARRLREIVAQLSAENTRLKMEIARIE